MAEVQRVFQAEHGKVVAEATQALAEINKKSEAEGTRRMEEAVTNIEKDLSEQIAETQNRLNGFQEDNNKETDNIQKQEKNIKNLAGAVGSLTNAISGV